MMLANFGQFKKEYQFSLPTMEEIIEAVNSAPPEAQRYTGHLNRFGALIQYVYYVSLVREFVDSPDAVIVDWGGQYGQVTKLLMQFFPNVQCYHPIKDEKDEYYVAYWQDRLSIKNVKFGKNYRTINYCDNFADAVISSGVLEHTDACGVSELDALTEVNRILRDNGMLFIWNLPYRYGSVELLNSLLGRWHHSRRYTKKDVVALLEKTGFRICAVDHHELMNIMVRNALGKIIGHDNAFIFDYLLSKMPILNLIAQHFTIVAKKS